MAPEDQTPEVLTSLPKTRPQRRSAKREAARANGAAKKPAVRKTTAAARPKAKAAPKAKPKAAAGPKAAPRPKLPPAGFASPQGDTPSAPSATELVGTAIQAAGELAQIGAAVGKQALKSALRLGR